MTPPQHIVNATMEAGQNAAANAKNELTIEIQNDCRRRRQRRRPRVVALPTALAALVIVPHTTTADPNCPPTHSGWAPSQDCTSYHWCSAGKLSSLPYDCHLGLLFDSTQLTCAPAESVECGAFWQNFVDEMAAPPPPPSPLVAAGVPTPMPSPRPSTAGEPIYYVDFPSQSCKSDINSKPGWVSSEDLFSTKKECCEVMVDWISLEQCLGANWVETNVVFEPTTNPTVTPTLSPSETVSQAPSLAPSGKPTHSPTPSPSDPPAAIDVLTLPPTSHLLADDVIQTKTDAGVTGDPSSSGMEGDDGSYLMELLEWANNGVDPFSTAISWQIVDQRSQGKSTTFSSTSDTSIIELLLPVVADATISSVRTEVNFGMQSALAVDGGGSRDEKYDSLLKFDISLLDTSRPVESAKLKLHALAGCSAGGMFSSTLSDQDWESDKVTWISAPKTDGAIASLGQVSSGQDINVDLSSAMSWHEAATSASSSYKYMTIRIESSEHSRCLYSSMEGAESEAPTLEIKYKQETAIITSDGSSEESLMTIAHGDFLELSATDDATVVALQSKRNFGQEPNLLAAYDSYTRGIFDIIIRFDLSQIQDTIPRSSVLSLFAETDCESAGTFATTSVNLPWTEDSVNWSNAPVYDPRAVGGTMIGTFGGLKGGNWYGFNVHQALTNALLAGSDAVTFRVSSGDLHPCQYSSRNGGLAPKLMVAF